MQKISYRREVLLRVKGSGLFAHDLTEGMPEEDARAMRENLLRAERSPMGPIPLGLVGATSGATLGGSLAGAPGALIGAAGLGSLLAAGSALMPRERQRRELAEVAHRRAALGPGRIEALRASTDKGMRVGAVVGALGGGVLARVVGESPARAAAIALLSGVAGAAAGTLPAAVDAATDVVPRPTATGA